MKFDAGSYDVAVIGAGHAGIEAGLACARMGLRTVVFTINLDAVGNMPCNPAIGGTGKGHLVRELDALGGEMAKAADACCIQYRMLNLGKGPAVHSLRAQADRRRYQEHMKHLLEQQERLDLKQAMITEIGLEDGAVASVTTRLGAVYRVRAAVIASGTYLDARVITGDCAYSSGPDGMQAGVGLTALRALACACAVSKPARLRASTVAPSTFPGWSSNPATRCRSPSLFPPSRRRKTVPSAISPIPTKRHTASSGKISTAPRSSTA